MNHKFYFPMYRTWVITNCKIINSILNPTTKDSTRTYTTSLNLGYHIVVTPHSNEEKNIPPGISDTISF